MRTARFSGHLFGGGGGVCSRGSACEVSTWRGVCHTHSVDRQTPVKILPCPKLRLRAVTNSRKDKITHWSELSKVNCFCSTMFQIENIQNFVNFCEMYGVRRTSLFQPPDLYETGKTHLVLSCIRELGSAVSCNLQ